MKLTTKDIEEADMVGAVVKMRESTLSILDELHGYFAERTDFSDREEVMSVAGGITTLLNRLAQIKVWTHWQTVLIKTMDEKGENATMEDVIERLTHVLIGRTIASANIRQDPVSHAYSTMVNENYAMAINTCRLLIHADTITRELSDAIGPGTYEKLRAGDKEALTAVSRLAMTRASERCAEGGMPFPTMPPGLAEALGLGGMHVELSREQEDEAGGSSEGTGIIDGGPKDSAAEHARVFA